MSIKIEKEALEELRSILEEREIPDRTVRLFLAGMGCSGPQFNLSIDEINEDDLVVEDGDFKFFVEKSLVDEFGDFEVKFFDEAGQRGVYVEPTIKPAGGCGGCGGGCGA